MVEQLVPILKVADTARAAEWYARLGFTKAFEQRYSEEFPGYVGLQRGDLALHLSERAGDATPDSLIYLVLDEASAVDSVAAEFGAEATDVDSAREVHLTDPDGNRVRVGAKTEAVIESVDLA